MIKFKSQNLNLLKCNVLGKVSWVYWDSELRTKNSFGEK